MSDTKLDKEVNDSNTSITIDLRRTVVVINDRNLYEKNVIWLGLADVAF